MATRPTAAAALMNARTALQRLITAMTGMHAAFQITPSRPEDLVRITATADDSVTLTFNPMVCFVPDRANKERASLYIVLEGNLKLNLLEAERMQTASYATKFAYFRATEGGETLEHCYGGHYDFDPTTPAHPVAHMQLASQVGYQATVNASYRSSPKTPGRDLLEGLLDRVRTPTLQMDVLSMLLQLSADHLVNEKSTKERLAHFRKAVEFCPPFEGYQAPPAPAGDSCHCARGFHSYRRSS